MKKYIFTLFFALGPVYWFLFIPPNYIAIVKYLLFMSILSILIKDWFLISELKVYKKTTIIFSVAIFLIFVSLTINSEEADSYKDIINYLVPLFFTALIPLTSDKFRNQVYQGLLGSTKVFSCIALFIPLALFIDGVIWINPIYSEINVEGLAFTQIYTGFGGSRTGWSVGASFIAAISMFNIFITTSRYRRIIEIICFSIITISILIPSGRSGIISLLLLFFVFMVLKLLYKRVPKYSLLSLAVFSSILFFYSDKFRLDSFFKGSTQDISNGRFKGYMIAIESIYDNFFFGVGISNSDMTQLGLEYAEVHNVFLKFLMNFGFIPFIPFLLLFSWIFFTIYRKRSYLTINDILKLFIFINVPVLVSSFTEPNVIFSNFFNTISYWFVFSLFLFELHNRNFTKSSRV